MRLINCSCFRRVVLPFVVTKLARFLVLKKLLPPSVNLCDSIAKTATWLQICHKAECLKTLKRNKRKQLTNGVLQLLLNTNAPVLTMPKVRCDVRAMKTSNTKVNQSLERGSCCRTKRLKSTVKPDYRASTLCQTDVGTDKTDGSCFLLLQETIILSFAELLTQSG